MIKHNGHFSLLTSVSVIFLFMLSACSLSTIPTPTRYVSIVFDANGATGGAVPEGFSIAALEGFTLPAPGTLVRTDCMFTGWNTEADRTGLHLAPGAICMTSADILTLYAEWKRMNIRIDFDANGATEGTVPESFSQSEETSFVLPEQGTLAKTGYAFTGWNTKTDGTGVHHDAGGSYTTAISTPDAMTFYAEWKRVITVTFDANGATDGTLPESFTTNEGESFDLPVQGTLEKKNWTFAGWNTEADGSGVHYDAGTVGTALVGPFSSLTLYAQWKLDSYLYLVDGGWSMTDDLATLSNATKFSISEVIVPDDLTAIPDYCFDNFVSLRSIVLSSSVKSIGQFAFRKCVSLEQIDFPDGLTKIGDFAFSNCTSLGNIALPGNLVYLGMYAFDGCASLTSVIIPAGVPSIRTYTFNRCTKLSGVTILGDLADIGDHAFFGCTGLSSVEILGEVTSISEDAFYDCTNLKTIDLPDGLVRIDRNAFRNCTSLKTLDLPASLASIDDYAFYGCTGLESITVRSDALSIGWNAFYGCTSLRSVDITGCITILWLEAFGNCTKLEEIVLPIGLTSITGMAFINCTSLKSASIPFGVTEIGSSVFRGCTNLVDVNIPDKITSLSEELFAFCTSLTSVDIPSSVTSIGRNVFTDTGLGNITIPDKVASIEYNAFGGCVGLTDIFIPKSVMKMGNQVFNRCTNLTTIRCEAAEMPPGWDANWLGNCTATVFWNQTR